MVRQCGFRRVEKPGRAAVFRHAQQPNRGAAGVIATNVSLFLRNHLLKRLREVLNDPTSPGNDPVISGQRRVPPDGDRMNIERKTTLIIDRKSTRLNSSHANISYAVFCL